MLATIILLYTYKDALFNYDPGLNSPYYSTIDGEAYTNWSGVATAGIFTTFP